ncbi:hypothetical protein ACOZ32_00440 [Halobacterium sp. MBLA0001]|uniref:hypothetical protein n=1 Tax=Halobacterium sp. MBLA0001 TaxID=3413511 RepID=UPI003C71F856
MEGTTKDNTVSWSLALLHKCTNSQIGNGSDGKHELDHVHHGINVGSERYFAALLTESEGSDIDSINITTLPMTLSASVARVSTVGFAIGAHEPSAGHVLRRPTMLSLDRQGMSKRASSHRTVMARY